MAFDSNLSLSKDVGASTLHSYLDVHSASFQQKQRLPLTSFLGQLRSGVWPKRGSLECCQIAQATQQGDLRTYFRAKPSYKYSVPISLLIFLSFSPLIRINVKLSLLAVSTDFYSVTAPPSFLSTAFRMHQTFPILAIFLAVATAMSSDAMPSMPGMSVEATRTTSLTTTAAIVEHPAVTSSMLSSALAPNSTLTKPKMSSSSNMPMPTNSQVLAGDAGAFGVSVSYTLLVSVILKVTMS
jgi:hypothetical protein